jgi:integrase
MNKSMIRQIIETNAYSTFLLGLKAPETKRQWPKRFKFFLDFVEITGTSLEERVNLLYEIVQKEGSSWLQKQLIDFVFFQKSRVEKKEISESTVSNYFKPVKLFCDMNNILVNWKLVNKGIPRGRTAAQDRIPTLTEIRKLLDAPDRRLKPIMLTMIASGIRSGAWQELKWKHVTPLKDNNGNIVAAKLLVYAGDREEYYTFLTLEAYLALSDWMKFRESYGEKITGESWLMRNMWRTIDEPKGKNLGIAKEPKKLDKQAIYKIVERALYSQKLRIKTSSDESVIDNGIFDSRMHEFKALHGYRKFFKTNCEAAGMKSINIEILMGHNIGISKSYYKPSEQDVLQDYLKAGDFLTIGEENKLKSRINEMSEKGRVQEYIINKKLMEKDEEIQILNQNDKKKEDSLAALSDQLMRLMKEVEQIKGKSSK